MNLKNTSGYPNWFARRMIAWCANQIGLPVGKVREVVLRSRSRGCVSGHYMGGGKITGSVGPDRNFPHQGWKALGIEWPALGDRVEAFVAVVSHELMHLKMRVAGNRDGNQEHATVWAERKCLEAFRANREALLAAWNATPLYAKPQAQPQAVAEPIYANAYVENNRKQFVQERAQKAQQDLARWERKLKLAKTKVQKLKEKVKYYETK